MNEPTPQAGTGPGSTTEASPWAPFARPVFRMMWIAGVVSNIGSWMQATGAAWFMTSLSPSPLMVALVQAATTIPSVLFALPAGALADMLDLRKYLIGTQLFMVAAAFLLGATTFLGVVTAWTLLAYTFALGLGTAMMLPGWVAITPELVPRSELPSGVVLNSVGVNVAKTVGPAFAGALIAVAGPGAVFMLNALSFVGVVWALVLWRRRPDHSRLSGERLVPAMRAGVRYVLHAPAMRAVVIRGIAFFVFASAIWALLPLVARQELGRGPEIYGSLLASMGIGSVFGGLLLPLVRRKISYDRLMAGGTVIYALGLLALALIRNIYVLSAALFVAGMAWIAVFATLQVVAQLALPGWVRARGLAIVLMVIMGSLAGGSVVWGQIAVLTTIPTALIIAAIGAVAGIAATWTVRIGDLDAGETVTGPS